MSLGYDTCVYCIVLDDAAPNAEPHEGLLLLSPGIHRCGICGTHWRYHAITGWQRQPAPVAGAR